MKSIGGHTYLEVSDLERAGFPRNTVVVAKHRGTAGWTFIEDPDDRRRILIQYATLKPTVKAVVDKVLGAEVTDQRFAGIKALVRVDAADVHVLRAYTYGDAGHHLPEEHIDRYARACAYLRMLDTTSKQAFRRLGYSTAEAWHQGVMACYIAEGIDLPTTYTRLRERVRQFKAKGAEAVISGRFGNQNRRLITDQVNAWLVSQYALPTKPDVVKVASRYLSEAKAKGWPALTDAAIYAHLMRPEVEQQWYLGRHGTRAWEAKFGHTLKLRGPSYRDAMWCGDGTKMNIWYRGANGMTANLQMYVVVDVFSEAILGWSLGKSENFKMQYDAAKMALTFSQAKPLQWLYDNQGGHKAGVTQEFYDRASKLHFPAQPYNAKRKPVERIIGAFQAQVMREHWAFTGQNITAKSLNSRANVEFVQANASRLPLEHELPGILRNMVQTWNSSKHPHRDASRIDTYTASVNPLHQALGVLDMVNLFWMQTKKPITYRKHGLDLTIQDITHTFEVYDADNRPDEEFRRRYINAQFIVRFDPEDLGFVVLYGQDSEGVLREVAVAQSKQTVGNAVVDLLPGERATIDHSLDLRKREVARIAAELRELNTISGVDPDTLVELAPFGGGRKDDINLAETAIQAPAVQGSAPAEPEDINPYAW